MTVTLCTTCHLQRWMRWSRTWKSRCMGVRTILQRYLITYRIRPKLTLKRQWTCWVSVSATTTPSTSPFTNNTRTSSNLNSSIKRPSSKPSSVLANSTPKHQNSTPRSTKKVTNNSTSNHYAPKASSAPSPTWRTSSNPASTSRAWNTVLSRSS